MKNTFLTFGDKYYRYQGGGTADDPGLTIGGFESAWLADLGYSYILEQSRTIVNATDLMEVYRDDNIMVFDGAVDKEYVHSWVSRLQAKADRLTGSAPGEHIVEFTAVMWGADDGFDSNIIKVLDESTFPFLDMEMFWSSHDDLHFKVYLKPNQNLRYLNNFSCHQQSTFDAIRHGVCIRLARLTTITDANRDAGIDNLYPLHTEALQNAGIAPVTFPTLEQARVMGIRRQQCEAEVTADVDEAPDDHSEASNPHDVGAPGRDYIVPGRDTIVKVGYCTAWLVPIHAKLKQLAAKHGCTWLRFKMAYHRFPNFQEGLQADLTKFY